jgi:NADH-quinone oxidoreductase subunit E
MSGFTFSEKQEEEIAGILAKYPFKKSAMLPLLTLVQRAERVISPEAMVAIGQKLDCSPAYVQSVLSFYTMYHTEKVGEYMVLFCINISCQLNGCDKLLQYTADKLDIKVGETTPDEKFTLHREECLADCTNAPMMRINDTFYGNLTERRIDQILDSLV